MENTNPITKTEYFVVNNYIHLLVLFAVFNIFSLILLFGMGEYYADPKTIIVPIIFTIVKGVIYFGGSAAYKRYLRTFVK